MAEDEVVPLVCPRCGKEARKSVQWLKNNHGAPILCAYCGASLGFQFAERLAAIEESEVRETEYFDKLKRGLSDEGKGE